MTNTNKQCPLEQIPEEFDVVIIGGGIVGAGIFRDLSLNGVNTLLIDKKDFSSQTSSKSSKMLHGGIRYLENMDFDLVWEALHEKNLWLKLAPHLCYESSFYLPIFSDSLRPKWMVKIGLALYDFLSGYKNSPHKMTSKGETLKALPELKDSGLKGAGVYYDAIVDDTRLTIEVILDGLVNKNCHALNYVGLQTFKTHRDKTVIELKDQLTGIVRTIECRELVFATGPFTDEILEKHPDFQWKKKLLPSKGSHLWLKKDAIEINSPMVLTPNDGRVIFVIPQKHHILIGTTEVEHSGDKFDLHASDDEVEYLIKNLNEYFPKSHITKEHVLETFAGLRPLVMEDSTSDRGKTARNHKYFQPRANIHVMMGGKYTTFRVMASEVTRTICQRLKKSYNSSKTKSPLRVPVKFSPFNESSITKEVIEEIKQTELVRTEEDLQRRIGNIKQY